MGFGLLVTGFGSGMRGGGIPYAEKWTPVDLGRNAEVCVSRKRGVVEGDGAGWCSVEWVQKVARKLGIFQLNLAALDALFLETQQSMRSKPSGVDGVFRSNERPKQLDV